MEEQHWLQPIFVENVKDASLLPFAEIIEPAIRLFEGSVPPILLAAAVAGAAVGGMTSWLIGYLLAQVRDRRPDFLSEDIYRRASWVGRKFGWPFLLFCSMPLGGLIPVAAGFLRINPFLAVLCLAVGRLFTEFAGA